MADVTPLLETRGIACHFGGVKAVDGIDFRLPKGGVEAIIGPNGAGKTTFVNLLSGRTRPTAGQVFYEGKDITRLPAFRRVRLGIAYTFQITSVFLTMTVADNVRVAAQTMSSPEDATDVAQGALEAVGLSDRAGILAGELAYGHQRLLEVAMGLALQPRLLILDEPTQGLSDPEIENFCRLVRRIATSATVLLIEHNMQVVMALANRILVLNRGRVLAEGSPDEIRDNRDVQAAYLGT